MRGEPFPAAVEVRRVRVRRAHPGPKPETPPVARRGLVLDPDVVPGPQRDRRRARGPARLPEPDALARGREPVLAPWRRGSLGVAQVLLRRDRQPSEIFDAADILGARDAGGLELAPEEWNGPFEDLVDHVADAHVLESPPVLRVHGLHLGIPELLLRITGRGT